MDILTIDNFVKQTIDHFCDCTEMNAYFCDSKGEIFYEGNRHNLDNFCCFSWRHQLQETIKSFTTAGVDDWVMIECEKICEDSDKCRFAAAYFDKKDSDAGIFAFGPYIKRGNSVNLPVKSQTTIKYLIELMRKIFKDKKDSNACGENCQFRHVKREVYSEENNCCGEDVLSYQVQRIIKYIEKKLPGEITLAQASVDLNLSKAYICRLFKRELNMSFVDFVNKRRIDRSKSLLADSEISMLEIALETGFASQSYFSRVFRKHMGMTPNNYRARNVI